MAEKRIPTAVYCWSQTEDDIGYKVFSTEMAVREREKIGLEYKETYIDIGEYDAEAHRPALRKLVEDCWRKEIRCVVVLKSDYLTSNLFHFDSIRNQFLSLGVRFISVYDLMDSDIDGQKNSPLSRITKAQFGIPQDDEPEIDLAPEKREWLKYAGQIGKPPYGYRLDGRELVPDEQTQETVRQIFRWADDGLLIAEIAQKLTDLTIPTPKGSSEAWEASTVKGILSNKAYIGILEAGKRKRVEGRFVKVPEEDWIIVVDHHPPIIDEDTFARVNELLDNRHAGRKTPDKSSKPQDLLNGLTECGYCGKALKYQGIEGRYKTAKYFCPNHKGARPTGIVLEKRPEISEEVIRKQVIDACNEFVDRVMKVSTENLKVPYEAISQQKELAQKQDEYTIHLARLYRIYPVIGREEFRQEREKIRKEFVGLSDELYMSQLTIGAMRMQINDFKLAQKDWKDYHMDSFDEAIVRALVRRIILKSDGDVLVRFALEETVELAERLQLAI